MTLYVTPSNEEPPHGSHSTRTNQRAFASPLAREEHPASLHTPFSTAWMPLEGLMQQWAQFGAEASTALELSATSQAFAALACEREALRLYTDTTRRRWSALEDQPFDVVLESLLEARAHWHHALLTLEEHLLEGPQVEPVREASVSLLLETMQQQLRLSTLLCEVERERLHATHCRLGTQEALREEAP